MTLHQLREFVAQYSDSQLRNEYECYNMLQSRGVQDEIRLTILEEELYNRMMFVE